MAYKALERNKRIIAIANSDPSLRKASKAKIVHHLKLNKEWAAKVKAENEKDAEKYVREAKLAKERARLAAVKIAEAEKKESSLNVKIAIAKDIKLAMKAALKKCVEPQKHLVDLATHKECAKLAKEGACKHLNSNI